MALSFATFGRPAERPETLTFTVNATVNDVGQSCHDLTDVILRALDAATYTSVDGILRQEVRTIQSTGGSAPTLNSVVRLALSLQFLRLPSRIHTKPA